MVDYTNTKITQHVLKINMDAAKLFKSGEQCFTKMSAIKVAFDQRHFAPSPIVLFPEMHSYCQLTRALLWRLITSQCCYGERVCVTDTDCMTLLLWWACLCHRYWLHDTIAMVSVSVLRTMTASHCCYGECVHVTDTDCMTLLLWWTCLFHRNTGKRSPSFRLQKKKNRCCSWRIAVYVKKCRTGNAHLGCLRWVNTYISLNEHENC